MNTLIIAAATTLVYLLSVLACRHFIIRTVGETTHQLAFMELLICITPLFNTFVVVVIGLALFVQFISDYCEKQKLGKRILKGFFGSKYVKEV